MTDNKEAQDELLLTPEEIWKAASDKKLYIKNELHHQPSLLERYNSVCGAQLAKVLKHRLDRPGLEKACQMAYDWFYQGGKGDYKIIGNYLKQALETCTTNSPDREKIHDIGTEIATLAVREYVGEAKDYIREFENLVAQILVLIEMPKDKPPLIDNPYGTSVHLDAGVYDGLYHKRFGEGAQAQRQADIEFYGGIE